MKHCFDYLRQTLMCASDGTLENLQTGPDGAKIASVDGRAPDGPDRISGLSVLHGP